MDKRLQKIIQSAKSISLSSTEKSFLLENIKTTIEKGFTENIESPYVMKGEVVRLNSISVFQSLLLFNFKQKKYMLTALLLVLTLSMSGTSYAAQSSLPGDLLYPVKIHVNENVESLLAIGAKSDAEVHLKQLERRLVEAEQLSKENKLTPEIKDQLKNDFSKKVEEMTGELDSLKAKGDVVSLDTIENKFEIEVDSHIVKLNEASSLSANSNVLETNKDNKNNINELTTFIKQKKEDTSKKFEKSNSDNNHGNNDVKNIEVDRNSQIEIKKNIQIEVKKNNLNIINNKSGDDDDKENDKDNDNESD